MALRAGDKLGPYEIIELIGKGGMGEVYRAHDPRLRRDVAIKISAERFSERFEREAHAVAALNHPNICAIYDVGPNYLVMEFIEGESPAGPMPIDQAMEIARQIAEALAEAHDKGVVHRDLKPANIKIKPDGMVKVLDFGLAKIGGGAAVPSEDSPTISMAATQAGVILGTAAYMAPEQARGKRVDSRADIWAFGVVLYELITGQRLFKGEDLTDTLASVVKENPDLSAVPPRVRRLLETCLQKDPKKRLQAIGDMRLVLEAAEPPPSPAGLAGRAAWVIAGVAVLLAAGLGFVHFREVPAAERSLRLSIPLPGNTQTLFLEISPDGKRVVLGLVRDGTPQLYLRSLDSGELQPLSGTTNARTPFWSSDSRFIGFFAESKLKVIPAAGGPAQVLCSETGLGRGGTWNRDGTILFANENGQLRRVEATKAGQCSAVGKDDPGSRAGMPVFLPDGNHFLYVGGSRDDGTRGVFLATLGDPIGRKVLSDNSSVIYTPPASVGGRAHLVFLRENTLMAQPFDEASLEAVGDPFTVAPRASSSATAPQVAASAATDGTLVYLAGFSRESQLTWFDRAGKELGRVGPRTEQRGVALSPDGNTVAIVRRDQNGSNGSTVTWLLDLVRESESRLTPPGSTGNGALWSPDGRMVWFGMTGPEGPGMYHMYQKDLKGGQLQLVQKSDPAAPARIPSDWSRDGRFVIYTENNPKTRADIWYAPVESGPGESRKMNEKAAVKLLVTDAVESQGQLSPDGKWLAYYSDESGKGEVYIRPFPSGSQVWKISTDGGREPRWRSDGKELFFTNPPVTARATLMAATIDTDGRGGLRTGTPQKLFEFRALVTVPQSNVFIYSPHPDRQRFLVNQLVETGEPTINVITNWQKSVIAAK